MITFFQPTLLDALIQRMVDMMKLANKITQNKLHFAILCFKHC